MCANMKTAPIRKVITTFMRTEPEYLFVYKTTLHVQLFTSNI